MVGPSSGQLSLPLGGVQGVAGDIPIDKSTFPAELRTVARLKDRKTTDICDIGMILLKAHGKTMICGLHAVQ